MVKLVKQRHSATHLLCRGAVAAASGTGVATGVYPAALHLTMMLEKRRRDRKLSGRQIRCVAREWVVAMAMTAARPAGFFGLPEKNAAGPRPIVAIHGYAMNRINFLPLSHRLTKAGLGPIYGFEYWSLTGAAAAAQRLAEFVEEICREHHCDRVDIIGHSLGGIIGRYYATLDGGAGRVHNLIVVASPHRSTGISDMFPGGALLRQLETVDMPAAVRAATLWSQSDPMVPEAGMARVRGIEQIVFEDLGHLSMLTSTRVAEEIIQRLR